MTSLDLRSTVSLFSFRGIGGGYRVRGERFKIIDEIIPEPIGGAHRDPQLAISKIGEVLEKRLKSLLSLSKNELIRLKEEKYLKIG